MSISAKHTPTVALRSVYVKRGFALLPPAWSDRGRDALPDDTWNVWGCRELLQWSCPLTAKGDECVTVGLVDQQESAACVFAA